MVRVMEYIIYESFDFNSASLPKLSAFSNSYEEKLSLNQTLHFSIHMC